MCAFRFSTCLFHHLYFFILRACDDVSFSRKIESGVKETVVNGLPHTDSSFILRYFFRCEWGSIESDMNELLVSIHGCVYSILMGNFPTSVNCKRNLFFFSVSFSFYCTFNRVNWHCAGFCFCFHFERKKLCNFAKMWPTNNTHTHTLSPATKFSTFK